MSDQSGWLLVDFRKTLNQVKEIIDSADSLTQKESDFLKEVARMASKFKKNFRLSQPQIDWLDDLWVCKAIHTQLEDLIE